MQTVEVKTQEELDAALRRDNAVVYCRGNSSFIVRGSSTVHAYDSSTVRAVSSVPVFRRSKLATVEGGVELDALPPQTRKAWCF